MSFKNATFSQVLDDLSARFILNLPAEEQSSVERLCFQIEQAHWFYEDFIRAQNDQLPSLGLRVFSARLFAHCPLLWKWSKVHEEAFDDFLRYKTRIPVRGAILLDKSLQRCLLVKGWKASSGWGFPKGKIDKDESDVDCAIREVYEETGFDLMGHINPNEYIEMTIRGQNVRLYIIPEMSLDTVFESRTRKEISKIEWHMLADLPTYKKSKTDTVKNKFYMVIPFLTPLKKWIKKRNMATKTTKEQGISVDVDADASSQLFSLLKSSTAFTTIPLPISQPMEQQAVPQIPPVDIKQKILTLLNGNLEPKQSLPILPVSSLPQQPPRQLDHSWPNGPSLYGFDPFAYLGLDPHNPSESFPRVAATGPPPPNVASNLQFPTSFSHPPPPPPFPDYSSPYVQNRENSSPEATMPSPMDLPSPKTVYHEVFHPPTTTSVQSFKPEQKREVYNDTHPSLNMQIPAYTNQMIDPFPTIQHRQKMKSFHDESSLNRSQNDASSRKLLDMISSPKPAHSFPTSRDGSSQKLVNVLLSTPKPDNNVNVPEKAETINKPAVSKLSTQPSSHSEQLLEALLNPSTFSLPSNLSSSAITNNELNGAQPLETKASPKPKSRGVQLDAKSEAEDNDATRKKKTEALKNVLLGSSVQPMANTSTEVPIQLTAKADHSIQEPTTPGTFPGSVKILKRAPSSEVDDKSKQTVEKSSDEYFLSYLQSVVPWIIQLIVK
ncbi:mRNA decapping complex catalytic subunit Dcp2 [Schizosaccharomyces cryophilus OY26]|uniref:mRNA decapping complex catalytic subunit Dcp2 n=1 Tax=Schizosaccharomyces cryophilus (strain OY26 / ATCC MYA-4695 / CBS 11777 / NBRC 106824 / NRRL Y48691) TaxID=653667 RepID=S9W0G3_SCHCR|nr:mRNA decapping complex catalytic subunit Dcp2 [Schizosaccharomyces cryophilus OY26]EPY51894.1 mRNA decapping complex catalytic subunit Dcp2 [Schizosaccharomyces cryophilus OY26]